MRLALLVTCLVDTLAPRAGQATAEVLEHLGHEVVFPEEQTCCGQMHVNSGYPKDAVLLARRLVRIFSDPSFDAVVCPSASCAGTVLDQYPRLAELAGDERLADEVAALSPRIHELSTFLVRRLGIEDVGACFRHRVAYHPTCHSLRGLAVGDAPLRLLGGVRGLELVELAKADACCGFGGTFAVKNADTSAAMLADKTDAVIAGGADICTAVDSSCLLQIGGGLSRRASAVRTMHLAEILASRE
ncbi:MAG: (Fe-S)-binding protein [Solirubrobacterales bacterium]